TSCSHAPRPTGVRNAAQASSIGAGGAAREEAPLVAMFTARPDDSPRARDGISSDVNAAAPLDVLPGPAAIVRAGVIEAHNDRFAAWTARASAEGARVEEVFAERRAVIDLFDDAERSDREIELLVC